MKAKRGSRSHDKGNHNLLRPKAPEIERQLPMMLDRQEIEPAGPDQIEDDGIIDDELAEIVALAKRGLETIRQHLGFYGPYRMAEQGTTRLRKAAQSRHDIVKETIQEPPKGGPSLRSQEQTDGIQIGGEIFGEIGPEASGYTGP